MNLKRLSCRRNSLWFVIESPAERRGIFVGEEINRDPFRVHKPRPFQGAKKRKEHEVRKGSHRILTTEVTALSGCNDSREICYLPDQTPHLPLLPGECQERDPRNQNSFVGRGDIISSRSLRLCVKNQKGANTATRTHESLRSWRLCGSIRIKKGRGKIIGAGVTSKKSPLGSSKVSSGLLDSCQTIKYYCRSVMKLTYPGRRGEPPKANGFCKCRSHFYL